MVNEELYEDFREVDSTKKIVKSVLVRVKMKEPCAVISMSGMGKRPIFNVLASYLESEQYHGYKVHIIKVASKEELEKHVFKLEEKFEPNITLIQSSYEEDVSDLIERLNAIREKNYINFVPILLLNLNNSYRSYVKRPQVLVKSMFPILPSPYQDAYKILNRYEIKYDLIIPESIKKQIIHLSGGHTGFMKNLFLISLEEPELLGDTKKLIQHDSIQMWLHNITNDLPYELFREINSKIRRPEVHEVLNKFGFVVDNKPFSPLIKEYIDYMESNLKNNVSIDLLLSNQEKRVFDLFCEKKNEVVSRDEIATAIWEEKASEKYSDWSIDQVVYRVRSKIKKSGLNCKIVTRKKFGFIMEEIE